MLSFWLYKAEVIKHHLGTASNISMLPQKFLLYLRIFIFSFIDPPSRRRIPHFTLIVGVS